MFQTIPQISFCQTKLICQSKGVELPVLIGRLSASKKYCSFPRGDEAASYTASFLEYFGYRLYVGRNGVLERKRQFLALY